MSDIKQDLTERCRGDRKQEISHLTIDHGNESRFINCDKPNSAWISFSPHLMNTMMCTIPDITYIVGVVSRFLTNSWKNWKTVKWILHYLRSTMKMCLCIVNRKLELNAYTNAYWADDKNSRKSTSWFVITFAWGAFS